MLVHPVFFYGDQTASFLCPLKPFKMYIKCLIALKTYTEGLEAVSV